MDGAPVGLEVVLMCVVVLLIIVGIFGAFKWLIDQSLEHKGKSKNDE